MKYNPQIVVAFFKEHGLTAIPEYRFCPERRWRADFYFEPDILLECDGGLFIAGGGRHNRGASMLKDFEKLNRAACMGFRVLRVTPQSLCMQDTIEMIREALND